MFALAVFGQRACTPRARTLLIRQGRREHAAAGKSATMTTTTVPVLRPDDPSTPERLLQLARDAAGRAYAPYSDFPVGAALLTRSGRVVTGCNVENASYGLTICAERTGAGAMVAQADSVDDRRIVTVAVVGLKASPCFPCGACRQVLHEFGCREVVVEQDGAPRSYPFEQILPHGFGPDDLTEG